jgi:hypothetical protein
MTIPMKKRFSGPLFSYSSCSAPQSLPHKQKAARLYVRESVGEFAGNTERKTLYMHVPAELSDQAKISGPLLDRIDIQRTHCGLDFGFDPFASVRDAARELLIANPKMKAWEVIAKVLADTGQTISPASISRLRHKLKTLENGS